MLTNDQLRKIVYGYWANRFGCKPSDFTQPGTLIIREDKLDESGHAILYHIDQMRVLRISTRLADEANLPLGYDRDFGSITIGQLHQLLVDELQEEAQGPFVDNYLFPLDFKPKKPANSFNTRQVFPEKDNPTLLNFYEACSEEDIDEAEIYIDEPDPVIIGLFDGEEMVAYASHRYWDDVIADIGVLVHPEYRSQGLGKAVVSELCQWCIEHDVVPMYRVFRGHVHSWRIQHTLGFTELVKIEILTSKDKE